MRAHSGALVNIIKLQEEFSEQIFNQFLDRILTPLRTKIVKEAGSREMVDVLMQLLNETDWDTHFLQVEKEEDERWAYYEAQDKAKEEARLSAIVTCHICHAKIQLRETAADDENMWGARFCNTCFAAKHLTCCLCHKEFMSADKLLNRFNICITCKRHEANRVNLQNGRTRKLGLTSTLEFEAWMNALQHFQHTCAYCGSVYQVLEHYLPVELDGITATTNCVPACYQCNLRKSNKHPSDFERLFPTDNITRIKAYFASL